MLVLFYTSLVWKNLNENQAIFELIYKSFQTFLFQFFNFISFSNERINDLTPSYVVYNIE